MDRLVRARDLVAAGKGEQGTRDPHAGAKCGQADGHVAASARLAQRPAMVTELAAPFAMSLPAVSRRIKSLARYVER
jgi:hypothetical protein